MDERIDTVLAGQYHILEKLGQGGQGRVYQARDLNDGSLYAIKFLTVRPRYADVDRGRFRHEQIALLNLDHPHIVRVYRPVDDSDPPFLVMQYVVGQTLRAHIKKAQHKPFALDDAVALIYQVGGATRIRTRCTMPGPRWKAALPTPPTPRRHIGQVWCEQLDGPAAAIGAATADEQGYYARWQPFERGMMWQGQDGRIYVFYEEGAWETFSAP